MNLQNFQEHALVASESLRNVFAEQSNIATQLSNIGPRAVLKKRFSLLLSRKDALGTRLATKIMYSSNLFLLLFFCY